MNGVHLRAFIERIEVCEENKRVIQEDIKDIYSEARSTGFDPKIMKKAVAMRRMDKAKRAEQEAILQIYLSALGMQ
ncbi:hypothetical protein [Caudoviricetes sp.]|nr:hypothetical protein [Caudoviricetes sp.]UOF81479.1 hypothetical protein [Caudoviricetes sp.]